MLVEGRPSSSSSVLIQVLVYIVDHYGLDHQGQM